jgi:phosphonopyruvate decarboxylase
MIRAPEFVDATGARGFRLWTGVPCSDLEPLMNCVLDRTDLRYVGAANEGEAVAIAAGAELGGTRAVAMFQNSGLGNAVNPLTSLTATFRIPLLLITTWRGQPDASPDEPQHELMGAITPELLRLLRVPWEPFPTEAEDIGPVLDRVMAHLVGERTPYALLLPKGSVHRFALGRAAPAKPLAVSGSTGAGARPGSAKRSDILRAIQAAARPGDVVLTTTGYTGRELYALGDRPSQLYMVGSMGCISSLALGFALAQPHRRIIAIDGDGAALMHLGALATVGYERPPNLTHILIDNGVHESTGGQATVSASIDFCGIAVACGYGRVASATNPGDVAALVTAARDELTFLHVPVVPGVMSELPRPRITPPEVAERLRLYLAGA